MVYNGDVHLCGPLEPGRFESMSKLAAAGQYRMQPASMHRRYAPSCAWSIRACRLQKRMAVGGNMFVYGIWHGG